MSSSAAVGSRGLGALFPELQLIAEDIGDESMNKTRFLLLSSRENNTTMALLRESITSNSEKATVLFELPHQVGSLAQVLSALAEQNCNLSKIQSKNIVSDDFQYAFWIDVELPSNMTKSEFQELCQKHMLRPQVLGFYAKGEVFES